MRLSLLSIISLFSGIQGYVIVDHFKKWADAFQTKTNTTYFNSEDWSIRLTLLN